MSVLTNFLAKPKSRKIAILLAVLGMVTPLSGLHKFYLGQPLWGLIYLLLWSNPIPRVACAIEVVWYLAQDLEQFNHRFNLTQGLSMTMPRFPRVEVANHVQDIATALQQLDQLRENGLISEYEFEQKRRQLIDRLV